MTERATRTSPVTTSMQGNVNMAGVSLEDILTIDAIRTHTKTDDVEYVTDEQLALYRKAAFEAAEQYTGRLFTELKQYNEPIEQKWDGIRVRKTMKHRLRYPTADGIVHIYGSHQKLQDTTLRVEPGTRVIRVPVLNNSWDSFRCCDPCQHNGANQGMRAMYMAGLSCKEDVPAGIVVGVLKHIAWNVMHPGDEIMTVRNKINAGESGIIGSNNVALISGALEQWRQYTVEY